MNHYKTALLVMLDLQECDENAKRASLERLGITEEEYKKCVDWLTIQASDKDLREAPLFFDYKG